MVECGCLALAGETADEPRRIRTVPQFEVNSDDSKYAVLRGGVFVGELDASASEEGLISIIIYKLD